MIRHNSEKLAIDLEQLFESHRCDKAVLQENLEELAFRRTANSRSLGPTWAVTFFADFSR
jgi:hypothetical protein